MRSKRLLLIFMVLVIAMVINSCKKSGQKPIAALFTGRTWQLTSLQVTHWTGNQLDSTSTLPVPCKEDFTFNADNTCTYSNFDCDNQTSPAAAWSLTGDQLYLQTNVVCKLTGLRRGPSSTPFSYASIQNLGQYSLILWTGSIQPNYSLTAKRTIYQYGFVRQ
ncbi:MAG: hypothetical protein ACHQIM_18855 [Sphingobacteriales bacterium]